jgi:hypothetical protein
MNKFLIFLIISIASLFFSIITIFNSPIINKIVGSSWGSQNCQQYSDAYDYNKKVGNVDNVNKKKFHKCQREKAMYGLEYSSLIIDIIFGVVCSLLGLFSYFDIFKNFEKKFGIIGLSLGTICFILTLTYTCYSAYIFNNDPSSQQKLEENGVFAEWENDVVGFVCKYSNSDDIYGNFAKYKDLGKKQYNYNKENYSILEGEPFECSIDYLLSDELNQIFVSPQDFCFGDQDLNFVTRRPKYDDGEKDCNFLYYLQQRDSSNKYIYDSWITSIIFSAFIIVSDIGLILFAFLIFKDGK